VVPSAQPAFRLIKGMFERRTSFPDSIFYDISAWTLPDAFGQNWAAADRKTFQPSWLGKQLEQLEEPDPMPLLRFGDKPPYAFIVEAAGYDQPRLLAALHRAGIRVQLATQAFEAEGRSYAPGSLLVSLDRQSIDADAVYECMYASGARDVRVRTLQNGLTPQGPDLGSSAFVTLKPPRVALLTGQGASPTDVGEVWHLLDTRYGLPPLLIDQERFSRLDLAQYNVVVLADGNFGRLSVDKLRTFINGGGTLIASGSSLRWLQSTGLVALDFRNPPAAPEGPRRPYDKLSDDRRALSLPGAIFEVELDLSHPLCYGYQRPRLAMFQSEVNFLETAKNPYATPAVFTAEPLLAGYLHERHRKLVPGAAALLVAGTGSGRVICFSGNPNFRGFWYGTNRLFANAVFFGQAISSGAVERK
ncbi:MAG: hypothetical protein JNK89_06870, partial [Saprospiraceae bacterium]|nr:hypothetical protein [Saprospiraceae bacterium]